MLGLPTPLPTTVLTGFLGAGKTTLLNHLLTTARGVRIGALVNEFGAVDIDTSLLVSERAISTGVVELTNGCICCTINESLCEAVAELLARRADLDHLVIETTGIADPRPVLDTLRLPRFALALSVDAIVTVVNAERFLRSLAASATPVAPAAPTNGIAPAAAAESECERQQLAAADLLVVNKSDLVNAEELRRVRSALAAAAPHARQLQCQHGKVAAELLLTIGAHGGANGDGCRRADSETVVSGGGYRAISRASSTAAADGGGSAREPAWAQQRPAPRSLSSHLEKDGFVSISFRSQGRLRLAPFERLRRSAAWASVVRAKGFLSFVECAGHRVTLQQCGRRVDVRTSPCATGEEGGCTFVLIGQPPAMVPELLLRELRKCEAPPDDPPSTAPPDDPPSTALPDDPPSTATALVVAPTTALVSAPAAVPCGPCAVVGAAEGAAVPGGPCADAEEDSADLPVERRHERAAHMTAHGHGSAFGSAAADEAPHVLAKLCADFVEFMRRDHRFEVEGVESGALVTALVRFRLLGWYSVAGDTLTAELREALNRSGNGVSWLAPCRVAPTDGMSHTLVLTQPLCGGHAEEALHRWADVQRAAEGVMMAHLGEIVCGGCDCLETLAGKVLT